MDEYDDDYGYCSGCDYGPCPDCDGYDDGYEWDYELEEWGTVD